MPCGYRWIEVGVGERRCPKPAAFGYAEFEGGPPVNLRCFDHQMGEFVPEDEAPVLLSLCEGERLIDTARDLRSEHGENPEYDRALVELVANALGFGDDEHRPLIERMVLR
jgi:hypothetical protein